MILPMDTWKIESILWYSQKSSHLLKNLATLLIAYPGSLACELAVCQNEFGIFCHDESLFIERNERKKEKLNFLRVALNGKCAALNGKSEIEKKNKYITFGAYRFERFFLTVINTLKLA